MASFFRDKFIKRGRKNKNSQPFVPEEPDVFPESEFTEETPEIETSFLAAGSGDFDFGNEEQPLEESFNLSLLYYDYWNPETSYSEPMEGQLAMKGFPEIDSGEQLLIEGFEESAFTHISLSETHSEETIKIEPEPNMIEAAEEPAEEIVKEPAEKIVEEIAEETAEETAEDTTEESTKDTTQDTTEDIAQEFVESANAESTENTADEITDITKEKKLWIHRPRGSRQWKAAIYVAVFFLLCLVPSIGLCITGPAPAAANEIAAAAPKLMKATGEVNIDYLSDLTNYVSKGFFGRLECITLWDQLCAKVFHSSQCDEVLVGKDGWLFYYTEADEIAGADRMTEREAWCAARAIYLMQNYCETNGVRFVFASPNGKAALYPEKIRDYIQLSEGRDLDIVQSYLEDMGVNFCDMYELFASQDTVLYWHTDSHWNGKGAALAADSLLQSLGYESAYYDSGFALAEPHTGDLYEMLYPSGLLTELDYEPLSGWSFAYTSNFRTVNDILISTESESGEGSLLMYRDSFGRNLYPYLAESFSTAEFSRLNNYTLYTLADGSYTDVIVEIGSKNLRYLIDYPAYYPAVERDFGNLTGYIQTDCGVTVEVENTDVPGCVKVTGTFGPKALVAVDSPVMLLADGSLYEAIPTADGFVAYLETEEPPTEFTVYTLAVDE